ncbi:MAG: DUF4333 domain-containing protein [Nocardioides sp.]|uniref:DUF4333 domain-containing protein n=1 Tax=Nocardioides sp. TaxID=35761 RepID=UPI0023A5B145|nr:DUF4333 domain-containing protein [Nocardioides sp.]MDE0774667.1 DUF4333 domain-containing protein [Nocardioides sp.]
MRRTSAARRRASLLAAAPLLVLALAACSVTVEQADLEEEVGRGQDDVVAVDCDGGLEGRVGATQDCTATLVDDTTVEVLITVTDVDGTDVMFDITEPDPEPE